MVCCRTPCSLAVFVSPDICQNSATAKASVEICRVFTEKRLGVATRSRQQVRIARLRTCEGLVGELQPLIEWRARRISWRKMGTASSASHRKCAIDGRHPSGSQFWLFDQRPCAPTPLRLPDFTPYHEASIEGQLNECEIHTSSPLICPSSLSSCACIRKSMESIDNANIVASSWCRGFRELGSS